LIDFDCGNPTNKSSSYDDWIVGRQLRIEMLEQVKHYLMIISSSFIPPTLANSNASIKALRPDFDSRVSQSISRNAYATEPDFFNCLNRNNSLVQLKLIAKHLHH